MRSPVVKLLVTGRMEQVALHVALREWAQRTLGLAADSFSIEAPEQVNGFTSGPPPKTPYTYTANDADPPAVVKFAQDLISRAQTCGSNEWLLALEDAERPGDAAVFTDTLRDELNRRGSTLTARQRQRMQERVSFHFAMPMIESWLFPDCNALHIAGSQHGQGQWNPASDAEQFQVADLAYTQWRQLPQSGCKLHSTLNFDQHPKHYLRFLSRDTTDHPQYKETRHGAKALAALDWSKVPQPSPHMAYLHALLDDLSDMLGATSPHAVPPGTVTQRRSDGVLRNL